jgi:hypothetical protein
LRRDERVERIVLRRDGDRGAQNERDRETTNAR